MRPTLRQIAAQTGYSVATVSRALAGSNLITAETRRVVLNCARELGYRFESCRNVAVIVPNLGTGAYFGPLVNALARELGSHEFIPIMISLQHLNLLEQLPFCGAVSLLSNDGFEAYWGERHIMPLVCINTSARHLDGIFMVGSNDAQGMTLALEHLLSLGHRRIGRIGGAHSFDYPENWNSHARDVTFRRIMREHELPEDLWTVASERSMIEVVKLLLNQKVTAIINLNEGDELKIYQALHILDKKMPRDISLVSWSEDNVAPCMVPSLSYLRQDYDALVSQAVKLLRKLLAGEIVTEDILVDYHFRAGASTGPVRPARRA